MTLPRKSQNLKYRKSKQRDNILELLKISKNHPTALYIYNHLKLDNPKLSLGTVYRNLKILKNVGLITELEFGNSFNRFDGNNVHHYHFLCNKCNNIYDIIIPELQNLNSNIEKTYHFKIETHQINFFGTCQNCDKK